MDPGSGDRPVTQLISSTQDIQPVGEDQVESEPVKWMLYKIFNCDTDADSVQQDLSLEEWKRQWQGNKRFERQTEYRLHGHTLEVVDNGKYLCVIVSDYTSGIHVRAMNTPVNPTFI